MSPASFPAALNAISKSSRHTAARIGLLTQQTGRLLTTGLCSSRGRRNGRNGQLVEMHHYVMDGDKKQGFSWNYVRAIS